MFVRMYYSQIDLILNNLQSETKLLEMGEKISMCKQALKKIKAHKDPTNWVKLKLELAEGYLKSPTKDKKRNLELSIRNCKAALSIAYFLEDNALIAKALFGTGKAYIVRAAGYRSKNREVAILNLLRAERLLIGKEASSLLPGVLHSLGNAYRERVKGKRITNEKKALGFYAAAVKLMKKVGKRSDLGDIYNDIGLFYLDKYGNNSLDIETSIFYFKQALRVRARDKDPEGWASTNQNLGNAYILRLSGHSDKNTKRAIKCYRKALTINKKKIYPVRWAGTQLGIGNAYMGLKSNKAIKKARFHLTKSLEVFSRFTHPEEWAAVQISLGAAFLNQISGDPSDKVEKHIAYNNLALQIYDKNNWPQDWALVHHNLGVGYSLRMGWEKEKNIEKAIKHFRKALIFRNKRTKPILWANTQLSLSFAYSARLKRAKRSNIERAIKCLRLSISIYRNSDPDKFAEAISDLGDLYFEKSSWTGEKDIKKAINFFKLALDIYGKRSNKAGRASVFTQLGHTLLKLSRDEKDIKNAIRAYKSALRSSQSMQGEGTFSCLRSLGDIYFSKSRWEEAMNYYSKALSLGSVNYLGTYTTMGRNAVAGRTSDIQNRFAFALLKLGKYKESFLTSEKAKNHAFVNTYLINAAGKLKLSEEVLSTLKQARQIILEFEAEINPGGWRYDSNYDFDHLAKISRLNKIYLALINIMKKDYPWAFSDDSNLRNILNQVDKDEALVIPVITQAGTAIFFITNGLEQISGDQIIMVNNFREKDLIDLMEGEIDNVWGGWIGSYFEYLSKRDLATTTKFMKVVEITCAKLGEALLYPVVERALNLKIQKLHFIAHGGLQILPLHAAQYSISGSMRYLIDDFQISYSPSAYSLLATRSKQINKSKTPALLVGVNKAYADLTPLPNAIKEVKNISALMGVKPVIEKQANKARILARIKDANYIHFACHARFSWFNDPLFSSLYLANDERLYISELMGGVDNLSARLVALSACETGVSEPRELPDEQVGFTAAFLQMGVSGVLSNLWAVEDIVASLIMERFYYNHIVLDMSPAAALRASQIWLRELHDADIENYFSNSFLRIAQNEYNSVLAKIFMESKEKNLFANPFYWGNFMLSGT